MWIFASIVVLICMVPCFLRCIRGDAMNRLVALEAASTMAAILLMLLAEGFGRIPFFDIALTLAFLAFGGGLVFARLLERWL
ncbi:MAG TPA: monovalent cation/H+ antiporter complex subunit F [Bryobacteraceae bacterium]|jgi:multisubunit Na+/H+ antiporter MnhF subunit|nr:monovalent cation/H+ antiporter complex subunit F [Bryobacteraceae bacterium]